MPLEGIRVIDLWLDGNVSDDYDTLAQHWARVAKAAEEIGEAIAQLILWTGQNPRKPRDPNAKHEMLNELADTAMTGMLAIQHFTKDTSETDGYLSAALAKTVSRAIDAGYTPRYSSQGKETAQ